MQIGHTRIVSSYSSRVLINEARGVVWRYGFGSKAEAVRRNYRWLTQAYSAIPVPKPLQLRQVGPVVVASESYVAGLPLVVSDITEEGVALILAALGPLYGTFGRVEHGRYVSLIHGDLTHRNILQTAAGFAFIDGDRSTLAPPEFDVWLLLADAAIHRAGAATHRTFIAQLLRHRPDDEPYRTAARQLYALLPAAAGNEALWSALWTQFVARCLAHSVRDCQRRGKSLDWLDDLS